MSDTNLSITQISNNGNTPVETFSNQDAQTNKSAGQGSEDLVAEVNGKYGRWRSDKRPHEATWFVNAAMIRGLSNTKWNPILNILEPKKTPQHRSRDTINLILPKVKAKLSKFLKSRAMPAVVAASNDHEDILNAKATTKVLEYLWDKLQLEEKYEEAILWAMQTGKAFWWFYWRPQATAQVREPQPLIGNPQVLDVPLGDVGVELGSAFEVLVSDPGITRLQSQPEIMRVKVRLTSEVENTFGLKQGSLKSEVKEGDLFQYQRQIAQLGAKAAIGIGAERDASDNRDDATYTIVKELFTAPNAKYAKGRYVVVAGGQVVKQPDDLPYGLGDNPTSPYPVVEFSDMMNAGQFWPTTMVEQLSGGQRQYNRLRNQLDEQLKLQTHPWIFIPKQAAVAKEAFGSEAGQKIPFNFQPGMPGPQQWIVRPEPIVQDIYRTMDIIRGEFDQISNLYPAAIGSSGATSGFDTNLLQEAADSVHAPDIRRNELALRDAAYKIRRIVKMGYDIPRLITITGRDGMADVFEFSNEQVDEHANVVIDTGSSLPNQKSARIETILKLDERQAFGQPGTPERNRRLLKMLELGTSAEDEDIVGKDEDQARLENLGFTRQQPVEDPMPWEDHDLHYEIHTNLLKSQEIKNWKQEQRAALVRHVILHVKWKNPTNALQLAAVFGMQDVIQEIQQTMMVQAQAAQMAQPPAPPGPPPQAPPPQGQPQHPPQAPHPQPAQPAGQGGGQPAPQAA